MEITNSISDTYQELSALRQTALGDKKQLDRLSLRDLGDCLDLIVESIQIIRDCIWNHAYHKDGPLEADLDSRNSNSKVTHSSRFHNRIFERTPFIEIYRELKISNPQFLIIIQNGCYYEVLNEDAELLNRLYGWKIYERSPGVQTTGFPINAQKIWEDLRQQNLSYLVVGQLPRTSTVISRSITEQHPEVTISQHAFSGPLSNE